MIHSKTPRQNLKTVVAFIVLALCFYDNRK
nr:MAG TPA: hypothetical protein [Caudoviricetes sp.]